MTPPGLVLSLADRTGVMVQPWLEAGYECWIVDWQHPAGETRDGRLVRVGVDLTKGWLPPRREYAAAFAFPACTNLSVSGARWFKEKGLRGLLDGLELVERCRDILAWTDAPWLLENPISTISSYWRKPDYLFDPFEYAGYAGGAEDTYTKRTCLWTGGGFVMPPKRPLAVTDDRIHLMPPGPDRGALRSVTPSGFARAVFEANSTARREVA